MPKLKKGLILPTMEEDLAITAAALSDPDAQPLTDDEWERVKPLLRLGRPKAEITKERITIRLSREVLHHFRDGGPGWQSRIDGVLRQYVVEHQQ